MIQYILKGKIPVVRLEAKIYTFTRANTGHRLIQMNGWGMSTPCYLVIYISQFAINILILKAKQETLHVTDV